LSSTIETLLETDHVLARVFTLQPHEVGPLHLHTEVLENAVCISGTISVFLKEADTKITLLPGQNIVVPAGVAHQVENMSESVSKYLLVQSGGSYDFCELSD
jgi:quercetin dioxygenase-like cupin family protein